MARLVPDDRKETATQITTDNNTATISQQPLMLAWQYGHKTLRDVSDSLLTVNHRE